MSEPYGELLKEHRSQLSGNQYIGLLKQEGKRPDFSTLGQREIDGVGRHNCGHLPLLSLI